MISIPWGDGLLEVQRIVHSSDVIDSLGRTIRGLANAHQLQITSDQGQNPRPGDLWLGVIPERGWGEENHELIGWVRGPQIPLAVAQLRHAVVQARADEPVSFS